MRHRKSQSTTPSIGRRAAIGVAALSLVLSGAAVPGAIAETAEADPTGSLTWFATDDAGSVVGQTTYELEGPGGLDWSVVDNEGHDSNTTEGTITLDELPVGEYTITQVAAPEGYEVGDETQRVVVTEEGQEPGLPITFVNAVVAAEDEGGETGDEGAETGDAEGARGEAEEAEATAEPGATEPEPTEEAEQPAAEDEATEEEAPVEGTEERATEGEPKTADVPVADASAQFAPMAFPTPAPLPNPPLPEQCGLSIAIVLDLSNSLSNNDVAASKTAAVGFVNVLQGTPSSIGVYTFASYAPDRTNSQLGETSIATAAGADDVRQHINGLQRVPQNRGGTNWDYGFSQIVPVGEYDIIVFITDGNPTAYGQPGSGSIPAIPAGNFDLGTTTDQIDIDRGTASSNAHKAAGTFVIGLGVGSVTAANIRYISGNVLNTDYFLIDDYDELAALLAALALENCAGTLTVVKQVRGLDGQLSAGDDWTFTTSTPDVSPVSGSTDENGALNFEVDGYSETVTSRNVTITETQQPGFVLEQQEGANASCYNTVTGQDVAASNTGALGFTVPVPRDGSISCTVINKLHPTISLQKSWVDAVAGDTATLTINGQPTNPPVVSTVGGTPTFVDTTNVVTVGAVPGSTVTLAEVLAGTGNYTTDLSCVQGNDPVDITYTPGDLTGSLTMPTESVLCTFTNSRVLHEDLTVTKTVETSYDRAYTWSIDKVADPVTVNTPEGEPVTVDYDVTVTAEDQTDSNISISGQITVENPNTVPFTVDVTDNLPGASCTVDGGTNVTVPADGSVTLDYACTADSIAAVGDTNTATATWTAADYPGTSGSASDAEDVTFGDPANETDRYVTVTDEFDGGAPVLLPLPGGDDSLDWVEVGEGNSVVLDYTQTIDGVAGTCTEYPNVATVLGDGDDALDDADATVEVCVGADLSIEKNVVVSLDRTYSYDLDKDVDETRLDVDPETGEATFNYTVTVTDGPSADSNWAMSGQITVTNPNDWDVDAVVTDTVNNGGVCTVTGGADATIPANSSLVLDYTCTFQEQPEYDGINTATVTWDEEEYFTPHGTASGTAGFKVDDWGVTPINQTVTVIDDQTDPANPVELGEHTWTAEGATEDFDYPLTLEGTPGQCVTYTNNAWLEELQDVNDDQTVTVCWPLDLSVAKSVDADFDRIYHWDLDKKAADPTSVVIGADGSATWEYTVSVTPDGFDDSNWAMGGEITVTNPNSTAVTTTVTDVPDVGGGAVCTVATPELTVPGNGSATTAYSCSFTSQPDYEGGTNTATIAWTDVNGDPQTASTVEDVEFELAGETHRTVPVYDDMVDLPAPGELLGVSDYYIGPFEYSYELTFEGVAGECTDYTNIASIPELQLVADETVTVCVELGPEVSKTAEADFDREYFWDITKVADETEVTITEGGEATFDYLITTIPSGFEDSGWTLGGQITVTNPNAEGDMTVTVTDVPTVGGECTVVDGVDIVLEPGEEVVLDYTCSFEEEPDYTGTNTATVVWETEGGESGTTTADAPINFVIDEETNLSVDVYDDEATGGEPTVWVGTSHYYDGPFAFEYELSFPGVAGTCTDYTNTAVIPATGDDAEETVTVCVEVAPEVEKSAEASFDREYFWDIVKDVNATEVEIVGTEATFTYTVTTSPDGFEDSGWTLAGQISVTNPNDFQELTVTVTDVPSMGGDCTVVDGEDVVLAPSETRVFAYACTYEELAEEDYQGTNTAYVAWASVAGMPQSTPSTPVDVVFELDGETNLTVEVYDDKVTGEAPGELLGTSHYYDGEFVFTYDLTLPGVAGECVTHTNTAVIPVTGDDDSAEVTICIEDELVITKTAQADFDREYFWDVEKSVDQTSVTIGEGGVAEFAYVVTAIADGFEDSGWAMSGQITVTNPNEYDEGTVTVEVTDTTDVGGTCEVIDGEGVVIAPGATQVFDYVCTFEEQPEYEGSNIATVTWTGPDGETRTVSTDPVEVVFELDGETNLTVEVYDDKVTGEAPGELLGIANWHDGETEFPYTMQFPGVDGECTDYTNTAVIPATGDGDDQTVTVCVELGPEVSKTAAADYDREYFWDITKVADETEVTITEGGEATFDYLITTIPSGFEDSGWTLGGQITVTNPNAEGDMTVTVTDVPTVGGECTVVDGVDIVLEPGEEVVLDYTCSFEEEPAYTGTNTATVVWETEGGESGTTTADAPINFVIDEETNLTVDVYDDEATGGEPTVLVGTSHYYDGDFEFEYSLSFPGVAGTCTDYTNTAVIPATGDDAEETVTVCVEAAPEVEKSAEASFDREYFWDIVKDVNATEVEIVGTEATFTYTVTTSPEGFEDSGWTLAGEISVTNPNDFQEMTVTVTDVADVGGTCTVVDGEDAVIAAGATQTFAYSCTFEEEPAYEGVNTAYVDWVDAAGEEQTETAEADVVFELDGETNLTVDVYDDKVTLEAPGELLGTSHYYDGPFVFTYDLTLPGVAGECVTHTNTAVIPATGDDDTAEVTICIEDELVITKTAEADFDREYFWDLEKSVDQTEVTISEGGVAEFAYVVTAIADGFEDSGWAMSGQITVTNPNQYDEGTVTVEVTDTTDVGGTCEVIDGEGVVIAPGATVVFDYVCTFEEQPEYEGSNIATVTWTGPDGETRTVTTDPVEVIFELDGETNLEVDVHDDKVTGEAPGELLGTANWHDGETEFPYTLEFPGVAGECTDYTNTAVIPATGDGDDQTVTVCVELAPVVSKTAEASFDRTYDWLIEKSVDRNRVVLTEDGTAEFNYVVEAIPNGIEDSAWELTGQITVTNPNDFQELTVTVTDVPSMGGACTVVDGEDAVLAPSETRVFDYTCTYEELDADDYEGSNTAHVAWADNAGEDQSTASDPVEVLFELDGETNRTVDVYDDKVTLESPGEYLGTADYYEGPFEFEYSLDLPGVVGTCVDHTNTAVILDTVTPGGFIAPQAVGDEDSETVTVCIETAPEVSKTAAASFDRTYDWDIDKDVDATEVEIVGTDATFTYTVTTSPAGFADSGWELAGQISVTNPNDFQELTVTVTDVPSMGGDCTVVDGEDVVIDAGATVVFDYTCTYEEQPDYEGTNTAYVAWTNADGEDQSTASDPVDVVFELDGETNLTVDVHDDLVTGEAPGELLGTSHYYDGPYVFTYELTLPGVAGECVDHTNTAVIPATGDEAQATVTICVEDELVITKTAQADFDREYFWQITKEVDRTEAIVEDGALAQFNYVVSATPDGFADSGWAMAGQITVTNPNEYDEGTVTVEVTDTTDVGGTCEVIDGVDVVLAPGATEVFDYVCTFEEQPEYEGSNLATVTWTGPDGEERSSTTIPVDVVFELDEETNREVHVYDDKVTLEAPGELLGTAVWNAEGTPTEFTYSLSFGGEVGEWTYYENTASIDETGDEASKVVRVKEKTPTPPVPPEPPVIPTGEPMSDGARWLLVVAGLTAMMMALLGALAAIRKRREP